MICLDEDALICDLAETYHILNYRELSPKLVAILCNGLSDDSRIKRKASKRRLTLIETLEAAAVDHLAQLVYSKTNDAKHGKNRPKSILEMLEHPKEKNDNYMVFKTVEAFEKRREMIMRS